MKKLMIKSLCFQLILASMASTAVAAPGSCDVIGGGAGYTTALLPANAEGYVTATTYEELRKYVDAGQPFIFIPGTATITVPNAQSSLRVKSGQTIFSDRGLNGSPGALLTTPHINEDENNYQVYDLESKARMTGLRIQGPSGETTTNNKTIGLQFVTGSSDIEVDNNEIFNWPWAGVSVKASVNNKVHHNFIHDNIRSELGYGVVVQNGNAQTEVSCNTFNANRHAIAGSGNDGEGYNAHDNLVLPGGGRGAYHQFDMHRWNEGHGGKYVIAHDNIFDYGSFGTSNRSSIYILGVPTDGPATVSGNIFTQPWVVGSQFAVAGIKGAVPSEAEIKATNTFEAPATYTQDASGVCRVNVKNLALPVNCASVATVLSK
ncbi:right-handed parallel beta-helix repeat-containing protein [unidentified bacterial endosymbiont]|uniref:right-handed parallel beta-helix repeat-containing protein n=1 Tax=unidentified bacterial endosymbiont TaxID=2355 RepID=UPI00209DA56A|nr:right-handed parallel beta-helix repeat-containing protein [unidentified bacterial endosymbiont]